MIGLKYDEKSVQKDIKHFPFKVVNKGGQPRVQVDVQGYVLKSYMRSIDDGYADDGLSQ